MSRKEEYAEFHEELLTVYKHTIEDIERTKQWQWRFTYYTAIIQGVIVATYTKNYSASANMYLKFIFMCFAILLGILGIYIVAFVSQRSLEKFRERMEKCRKYFSNPILETFEKDNKLPFHQLSVLAILVNLILIALFLDFSK